MGKGIFFIAIATLLLSGLCSAQFYLMDSQVVEITVGTAGETQVTERYFLQFQNEEQLSDFRQSVAEIGTDLDGWKAYDSRIFPRIGQEQEIVVSGISFVENMLELDFLEISYALKNPIVEKKTETSRVIEYGLSTRFFNEFVDGSLWVIPEGTSIIVHLPKGIEIEEPVRPEATVEGTTVVWTGYVFGNELSLNYRLFKQISSFDFNQLLQEILQSDVFWLAAAAIIVISVAVFLKRKSISARIESYIISHSDLAEEGEED